ncbi:MAG TPA: preprotein translocase subunit YajC [Legionellales bacterium]|jgi:preprotein translocase subunit YajC|nr:preprotein translocase subunit YajC [Legionellales bacterium]
MGFLISDAMAQTAAAAPAAMETTSSIFMMVGIFVVFYLLIIRPQSKRAKEHRELITKIKTGDEVVTSGGILGEIVRLDEQFVCLSIQNGVEMVVQRQSISTVLPKGTINTVKKS